MFRVRSEHLLAKGVKVTARDVAKLLAACIVISGLGELRGPTSQPHDIATNNRKHIARIRPYIDPRT